uniref:Putative tick transposon n=1 Tax=Rhipicephalus microplus TaxID=6941 RepID=A0A6G5ABW0_RHIMP
MSFSKKFNLLSPQQFGFRPGYSIELALITLTEEIKQAIDRGLLMGTVFIDLTRDFDTINYCILIEKLESFGMSGPFLSFIKSCLTNRSQMVHVNGNLSSP